MHLSCLFFPYKDVRNGVPFGLDENWNLHETSFPDPVFAFING